MSHRVTKLRKELFGKTFSFECSQESLSLSKSINQIFTLFSLIQAQLSSEIDEKEEIDKKGEIISKSFNRINYIIMSLFCELQHEGIHIILDIIKTILIRFVTALKDVPSRKFLLFLYCVKSFFENLDLLSWCSIEDNYSLVNNCMDTIRDVFLSSDTSDMDKKILSMFPIEDFATKVSSIVERATEHEKFDKRGSKKVVSVSRENVGIISGIFGMVCDRYDNHEAANAYYQYAADEGSTLGMINLAYNKLNGIKCAVDIDKAIKLYEKVRKLNPKEPYACLILGQIYGGIHKGIHVGKENESKKKGYKILRACWDDGCDLNVEKIKQGDEHQAKLIGVGLCLGHACLVGHWGDSKIQFGKNILTKLIRHGVLEAKFILVKVEFINHFHDLKKRNECLQQLCDLFKKDSINYSESDYYIVLPVLNLCIHEDITQPSDIEACVNVLRSRFLKKFNAFLSTLELSDDCSVEEFINSYKGLCLNRMLELSLIQYSIKSIMNNSNSPRKKLEDLFDLIDTVRSKYVDLLLAQSFIREIIECFYQVGYIIQSLGANKTEIIDSLARARKIFYECRELIEMTCTASSTLTSIVAAEELKDNCDLILSIRKLSIFPEGEILDFLESQIQIIYQSLPNMKSNLLQWALVIHAGACIGLPESIINCRFLEIISKFLEQDNIEEFLALTYYSLALLSVGDCFFKQKNSQSSCYSEDCRRQIGDLSRKVKEKIEVLKSNSTSLFGSREKHQIMMADNYFRDHRRRYFSKKNLTEEVKDEDVSNLLPEPAVSKFQRTIFNSIKKVFPRKIQSAASTQTMEITQETIIGPLSRDIVIHVGEETIVFEVNGPTHFVFDEELVPYLTPKHFLHQTCLPKGIIIININYSEELPDKNDRDGWVSYLQEKTQECAEQIPQFISQLALVAPANKARSSSFFSQHNTVPYQLTTDTLTTSASTSATTIK